MAETIDHRSAVLRMLNHAGVDKDTIETVMFHFDRAIEVAQGNDQPSATDNDETRS